MLKGIEGKKIVVIGDVILDHYRTMVPERVSPEAPVIIYRPSSEEWRLGGAANVANNLLELKAHVELCSVFHSNFGKMLCQAFESKNCKLNIHWDNSKKATVKERIVTRRQQILRIDEQDVSPISKESVETCFRMIKDCVSKGCDLIVISDYEHGVMTNSLCSLIMLLAKKNKIKVVVDSKSKQAVSRYSGATIALPNHLEARTITGLSKEYSDEAVATTLYENMKLNAIGLKMGARGIMLIRKGRGPQVFPPLEDDTKTEVADVTGAGDTVTAMVAAALACNHSYEDAMKLANIAAGIVVQKMGTSTASFEEVKSIWEKKS